MALERKKKQEAITLIVVFAGVLLVSALAVYFSGIGRTTIQNNPPATRQVSVSEPPGRITPANPPNDSGFVDRIFGVGTGGDAYVRGEHWIESMGRISLRLVLAALLGA